MEERRLVLVGCVKSKVSHPAPAKDLYNSTLWLKRRRYAEQSGMPWAILSAEHGMVDPDEVLEPYDRYLGRESASFKRHWGEKTAAQVLDKATDLGVAAVEIHAGAPYVENGLRARLESAGVEVLWPVEGMAFGTQLAWYQ